MLHVLTVFAAMLCSQTFCEVMVCPHLATQVDGGTTVGGLFVHSVSRSDEVTDICNMDAHLWQTNNILRVSQYTHMHTNHLI